VAEEKREAEEQAKRLKKVLKPAEKKQGE